MTNCDFSNRVCHIEGHWFEDSDGTLTIKSSMVIEMRRACRALDFGQTCFQHCTKGGSNETCRKGRKRRGRPIQHSKLGNE